MENNQEREDLSKIRHYKGTVKDFKNYWDEMAGTETNAFGTPEYQGFNDVHPTRGANDSKHWETSNVTEGRKTTDGLGKEGMEIFRDLEDLVGFEKGMTITNYNKIEPAMKDHKLFKKLNPREVRILGNALGNLMRIAIRMER
jgi:hypothetical protein|tara:strand:- start:88 stop:516 length:429 start_codon:yes stop_codon:yes gene_type:complete